MLRNSRVTMAQVTILLLTSLASVTEAAISPSPAEGGLVSSAPAFSSDLTAMLHRAPIHEPRVFEVAYKRIQDMESSPPCQQLATSTLIDACQSFNPMAESGPRSGHGSARSLDEVRKEYSARLAVCELQGIRTAIPAQCVPLMSSNEACHRTRSKGLFGRLSTNQHDKKQQCYPDATQQQLNECVESLYQVEQRWTSFSNAHSNAIVICQASRASVENLQHLETLKTAAGAQASMSEALSEAIHEAQSRLEAQKAFAEAVTKFQHDISMQLEKSSSRASNFLARMMETAESTMAAFVSSVYRSAEEAKDKMEGLHSELDKSTDSAHDLESYLQETHNQALERSYEYAAAQQESMVKNKAVAVELTDALANLQGDSVQALADSIRVVDTRMYDLLTTAMQAIQNGQDNLEESQLRMLGRQALIENSLAKQQVIIDDTSDKIQNMSFGSIGSVLASWVGVALCIVLVSKVSIGLAGCLASGAGITWALGAANAGTRLHIFLETLLSYIPTYVPWPVVAVTLPLVMGIGFYIGFAVLYPLVRDCMVYENEEGMLLKVEAPSDFEGSSRPARRSIWRGLDLRRFFNRTT